MYWIFIDESGSLNNNKGYFSISLVIIHQENFNKTKKFFKRNIAKIKNNITNKNIEIKGHFLKTTNQLYKLEFIVKECIYKYNQYICSYINNKQANQKWFDDKGATYNFMVKCAIERAFDNKIIEQNSHIKILSDQFTASRKYIGSLETYLITEFKLKKEWVKSITHEFVDSKKHWGVQLADFLSFHNFRKIWSNKINKINKYFRRIY